MSANLWQQSKHLYELLALCDRHLSDRKRRLFAVACCQRFKHLFRSRQHEAILNVAIRVAEGLANEEERQAAEQVAFLNFLTIRERRLEETPATPWKHEDELLARAINLTVAVGKFHAEDAADHARWSISGAGLGWDSEQAEEAAQCDLLREIVGPFPPVSLDPIWVSSNDRAAYRLAQSIHEEDNFEDLPILGDALEDAGCTLGFVLDHCRRNSGHVRGCWVLDQVLGLG